MIRRIPKISSKNLTVSSSYLFPSLLKTTGANFTAGDVIDKVNFDFLNLTQVCFSIDLNAASKLICTTFSANKACNASSYQIMQRTISHSINEMQQSVHVWISICCQLALCIWCCMHPCRYWACGRCNHKLTEWCVHHITNKGSRPNLFWIICYGVLWKSTE